MTEHHPFRQARRHRVGRRSFARTQAIGALAQATALARITATTICPDHA